MSKARTPKNLFQVWRCSRGVTAIEYALIAATVATVIIFTIASAGKQLDTTFKNTTTELSGMPGSDGGSGGSGGGTSDNGGGSGDSGGGTAGNDDSDGGSSGKAKGKKGR